MVADVPTDLAVKGFGDDVAGLKEHAGNPLGRAANFPPPPKRRGNCCLLEFGGVRGCGDCGGEYERFYSRIIPALFPHYSRTVFRLASVVFPGAKIVAGGLRSSHAQSLLSSSHFHDSFPRMPITLVVF